MPPLANPGYGCVNTSRCNFPDKLSVADVEIERVNVFKLLGVHIDQSLNWDDHVSAICNKAASRIYFLKQLALWTLMVYIIFTLLLSDLLLNMHALSGIAV